MNPDPYAELVVGSGPEASGPLHVDVSRVPGREGSLTLSPGRGEWERKAFWEEVLLEPDHVSRMHLMGTETCTEANYGPRSPGWWDTARGFPWTLCLPTAGRPLRNMRWV